MARSSKSGEQQPNKETRADQAKQQPVSTPSSPPSNAAIASRFKKVIKYTEDAQDLARTGAIVLNEGVGYVYFLWGQPSHAAFHDEDGTVVEGDRALSLFARAIPDATKVTWKGNEVIQSTSLRCSTEELLTTFGRLANASTTVPDESVSIPGAEGLNDVWEGSERRSAARVRYTLQNFPLTPTGPPLWSEVPTNVIHLDVLLGTMAVVLIAFEGPNIKGVGVVVDHELHDALVVDDHGMTVGKEAWEILMTREDGIVSAYEIDDEGARAIPTLWRCRVIYRDLDTRWVNAAEMLEQYGLGVGDRGVIVTSGGNTGVALFINSRLAAAYTSTQTMPERNLNLILPMFTNPNGGSIMLIVRDEDEVVEPMRVQSPGEAPVEELADETPSSETTAPEQPVSEVQAISTGAGDAMAPTSAPAGENTAQETPIAADGDQTTRARQFQWAPVQPVGHEPSAEFESPQGPPTTTEASVENPQIPNDTTLDATSPPQTPQTTSDADASSAPRWGWAYDGSPPAAGSADQGTPQSAVQADDAQGAENTAAEPTTVSENNTLPDTQPPPAQWSGSVEDEALSPDEQSGNEHSGVWSASATPDTSLGWGGNNNQTEQDTSGGTSSDPSAGSSWDAPYDPAQPSPPPVDQGYAQQTGQPQWGAPPSGQPSQSSWGQTPQWGAPPVDPTYDVQPPAVNPWDANQAPPQTGTPAAPNWNESPPQGSQPPTNDTHVPSWQNTPPPSADPAQQWQSQPSLLDQQTQGWNTSPPPSNDQSQSWQTPPPTDNEQTPTWQTPPPTDNTQTPTWQTPPPTDNTQTPTWQTPPPTDNAQTPTWQTPPPTDNAQTPTWQTPPPTDNAQTPTWQTPPPTDNAQTPTWQTPPPTDNAQTPTWQTQPPTDNAQTPTWQTPPPTDNAQTPTWQTPPPTDNAQTPTWQTPPPTDNTQTPTWQTPPPTDNAAPAAWQNPPPVSNEQPPTWQADAQSGQQPDGGEQPPANTSQTAGNAQSGDSGSAGAGFSVFDFSSVFSPMSDAGTEEQKPMPGAGLVNNDTTLDASGSVNYQAIATDLIDIAQRHLGDQAQPVVAMIQAAPLTTRGLRDAVKSVRTAMIPGFTSEDISEMAQEMSSYIADRLSAL